MQCVQQEAIKPSPASVLISGLAYLPFSPTYNLLMSLSKSNLVSLQKAGEAVYAATKSFEQTVLNQAQSLTANMAANPMSAEVTQAMEQFRMLAKVSQDLNAVEAQMRLIYREANELAKPDADVVMPQPALRARLSHSTDTVTDAEVKPAPAKKARKARVAKEPVKAEPIKTARANRNGRQAAELTPNDSKLLNFMQSVLRSEGWLSLGAPQMAKGAQLPTGSIGASLKKLLALGIVRRGERGMYQLG